MHGYRIAIGASVIGLVIAFSVNMVKLCRGRANEAIHRWSIKNERENCLERNDFFVCGR